MKPRVGPLSRLSPQICSIFFRERQEAAGRTHKENAFLTRDGKRADWSGMCGGGHGSQGTGRWSGPCQAWDLGVNVERSELPSCRPESSYLCTYDIDIAEDDI